MIGYIDHVFDRTWKPCTKDQFYEILQSERVAHLIREVRSGKKQCKNQLPAFIFGGCLDEEAYRQHLAESEAAGEKPKGSRCEQFLRPTGLFMMDFDREEGSSFALYEKFLATMRKVGIATDGFLALAHRSPSGFGLRLVLKSRLGSSIEDDQRWVSDMMDEPIDEACKDLSRLSFAVTLGDIFYVDPKLLFEEGELPPCGDVPQKEVEQPVQEVKEECSETTEFPLDYDGIPYQKLVTALEEQLGGVPVHGSRNNFIFTMACHLRYVCNDQPAWIAQVLPTYGEDRAKWRSTIESACRRAQSSFRPRLVDRAIRMARYRTRAEEPLSEEGRDRHRPPVMPAELPPLIELLTSKVPASMKPAVAHAVFPALGAHLGGVKFRYIDNVEHEATFMCCLLAKMSSGKSAVNKPIEYILADIVERDAESRRREQAWKDSINQKGANKEKPKRPNDLCVQVLVSDMTNAAFVQRLSDANGKFLYTCMDELELLDQLRTTNRANQVSQIIRLAFDCGLYGQERVGTSSITARVRVKWNWNASSTIRKGQQYFRDAMIDGTLSRINFCTIVPVKGAGIPVYGTYDEAFAEALKPSIDHLNEACGRIECAEAEELARELLEENAEFSHLSDDEVYESLSYRANVIAYLKAMTLYVANGCVWDERFVPFIRWSEQYDMWCKLRFFGERMGQEMDKENIVTPHGPRNMLLLLPDRFTREEVATVRRAQGKSENPINMLTTWVNRGYIFFDKETGQYRKSERYMQRTQIA